MLSVHLTAEKSPRSPTDKKPGILLIFLRIFSAAVDGILALTYG